MAIYDKPTLAPEGVPTDSYSTCQSVEVASPWTIVRPVFKTTMLGGPPYFTIHPVGQTAAQGDTVVFTVAVGGFQPITLQWRKDGVALAGETNSTLTLSDTQTTDAGVYDAVATNVAGEATSDPATLTVEGGAVSAIYLGNAGTTAPAAYSAAEIKALGQTAPQFNPVFREEFSGNYEISTPASGVNEYRVLASPIEFLQGTSGLRPVEFRSSGSSLPMQQVQDDLVIDGVTYVVYRTSSRSAGDFTIAGNTAITVVVIH